LEFAPVETQKEIDEAALRPAGIKIGDDVTDAERQGSGPHCASLGIRLGPNRRLKHLPEKRHRFSVKIDSRL
jgi:hypothetical protein